MAARSPPLVLSISWGVATRHIRGALYDVYISIIFNGISSGECGVISGATMKITKEMAEKCFEQLCESESFCTTLCTMISDHDTVTAIGDFVESAFVDMAYTIADDSKRYPENLMAPEGCD